VLHERFVLGILIVWDDTRRRCGGGVDSGGGRIPVLRRVLWAIIHVAARVVRLQAEVIRTGRFCALCVRRGGRGQTRRGEEGRHVGGE
jgi:hypothetical protein